MTKFARINHEISISYDGDIPETIPEKNVYEIIAEKEHDGYMTGTIYILYDAYTGISFTIDKELVEVLDYEC